ncbi:hypothetical protein PMIN01_07300 [Paraphaeosphaeria minitans]|uniref:Uncharacterized protein n=1 Tax=Paraphaeosphaeria minitans TaxID=565426 RepID=A0A9P6GF06_9PLEO|nr:hypothetical protein PMIN01_07300 [Paraphaeosphaeria minitans]
MVVDNLEKNASLYACNASRSSRANVAEDGPAAWVRVWACSFPQQPPPCRRTAFPGCMCPNAISSFRHRALRLRRTPGRTIRFHGVFPNQLPAASDCGCRCDDVARH